MNDLALTQWKRVKEIQLRLRVATLQEEQARLHTELHEATAQFGSAYAEQVAGPHVPLPRSPTAAA